MRVSKYPSNVCGDEFPVVKAPCDVVHWVIVLQDITQKFNGSVR